MHTADCCKTKYPIFFIHGTGFRDRKILGYWGRIPKAIEALGGQVFYGNQDSWATIEQNAKTLQQNLRVLLAETGYEKVNMIAHSKGGLEARYLASTLQGSSMIASITTISTPHHGSKTMDIFWKFPKFIIRFAAVFVNFWFRLLGDQHPDFYGSCEQFTTRYMGEFNSANPDANEIFYQSYATMMRNPFSDLLMFLPNLVITLIEGANDGLVTSESATWTNFRGTWKGATWRGISHADSVDLRRKNFSKMTDTIDVNDIRECYIAIVSSLKEKGF